MNDFNDIKSEWVQRNIPELPKNGYKNIIKNSLYLKRKQRYGQIVLMVTVIILICFFIYISGFKNAQLSLGMSLMVGSLLFRVVIEFFSQTKLNSLAPTLQVKVFNEKIMAYYKSRLVIHYWLTPFSFTGYVIGFIIMLPIFKLNVSTGLYNYIIISSILVFLFLIILITVQIKKELKVINEMKKDTPIE